MSKDKLSKADRYKLVINARNFHYENFNKWMTYFYVAIGALFVGYCTILSSEKIIADKRVMLEYLVLTLGYIVSTLWYWSAKGYYYWNINFITLVNHYEQNVLKFKKKKRVYAVFANKKTENHYYNPIRGANISTSKVAILFAFIITSVWGFIIAYNLFIYTGTCLNKYKILIILISLIASFSSIFILSWLPKTFLKSYIDHFPDLEIVQPPYKD